MKNLETQTKSFNTAHKANLKLQYHTKDMDHKTWIELRSEGLGGSEIAAVVGGSKYESQLSLWRKKTGQKGETESTEQMRAGNLFEEVIAKEFSERYKWPIKRVNYIYSHPEYDWTRCNVDYITQNPATGRWGILEIKNPSEYARGEWETNFELDEAGNVSKPTHPGSIPPYYHIQGQFYAGCSGLNFIVTCAMIGGFTLCPVYRSIDKSLFRELLLEGDTFWKAHVLTKKQPRLEASNANSRKELNEILGESAVTGEALLADPDLIDLLDAHLTAKQAEKAAREHKDSLAAQIVEKTGDHSKIMVNGKSAGSWSAARTTITVDKKKLEADHPEIFEKCTTSKTGNPIFTIRYKK
jgi:putative phage-type endonuclease